MKRLTVILFSLIFILIGCNQNTSNKDSSDDLLIYTSIYPIQYIVEQLAGDLATVESVYPPGVDAHTYEPTSKEITNIAHGDAFIYLGAGMEGFAETAVEALQSQDIAFLEIGQNEHLFLKDTDPDHHDLDPHVGLDPLRMIEMGEMIKKQLIELKPSHENQFNEHFENFKENMLELDGAFLKTIGSKENKQIIVTHAAYGYWEGRYGIEQIAISGLSSSDEPTQKELAAIAKKAKQDHLKYVIFEQNSTNRVATIIQEHIGAKKLTIHNLETLTEEDIANGEDYISLMMKNLDVLNEATN